MRYLMRHCAREERAQATVEMAVVAPVLIVLALISYNLMMFACAVARFDRVAPDVVLAHAVAPEGTAGLATTATVQGFLADAMEGYDVEISVRCEDDGVQEDELLTLAGRTRTYDCMMAYRPWPANFSIAGVSLGAPLELRHERAVVVDPWRPGVVM